MRAKLPLIIQAIGMYVMHLPLYVIIIINNINMDEELRSTITNGLLIATLAVMIIMIPICILNVAASLVSVTKGNDPSKTTMAVKLALIPWYALNFVIGFVLVSIFLNPFMMIAIPVIIVLLVTSTYLLMISTSIGDIAYCVHNTLKKKWTATPSIIFTVVLLFIFCLDVIGAVMVYFKSKKLLIDSQPNNVAE